MEAIRARNEFRKLYDFETVDGILPTADIDALIAEVERLRPLRQGYWCLACDGPVTYDGETLACRNADCPSKKPGYDYHDYMPGKAPVLKPESNWIPVTERLPPAGMWFVTLTPGTKPSDYDLTIYPMLGGTMLDPKVTHWSGLPAPPLPEPPK